MSAVLHLVSHDLRAHRTLLLVWTAIVVAHPLMAAASLAVPDIQQIFLPIALIASRLTLGAITIATIVQADSPLDDRTFWRTRPIAGSTMATAKLVMGGLFLLVPLAVVLLVAAVLGLPASHLPSTVAQVVVADAAAVGLALFASARTRSVPSMIVALMATLVGLWVLYGLATETLRVPWLRQWYVDGPPSPVVATPTLLALTSIATWTLTAFVFTGPSRRLRQLVVAAGAVLALAIVWLSPTARLHSPEPKFERTLALTPLPSTAHARLSLGRIAIICDSRLDGVRQGDKSRLYVAGGTLYTPSGPVSLERADDWGSMVDRDGPVPGHGEDERPMILAVLNQTDFERLAGQRVRITGQARLQVSRTDMLGTVALAPGATLDIGDLRVRLREAWWPAVATSAAGWRAIGIADTVWTSGWTRSGRSPVTQWWLISGGERAFINRRFSNPFGYMGLLPTLPSPFGWQRSLLTIPERPLGARDVSDADMRTGTIEFLQQSGPYITSQDVDVEFDMPSTVQ